MYDYDAIVVGAGSLGVPIAMALGAQGIHTLVLDRRASPGQGQNKHAIGGIRATHSDPAKIIVSLRSIEVFASWQATYGDDIEWVKGGYTFPVYRPEEEHALKSILEIQKAHGLNIDFHGPAKIKQVVPGINPQGLMGGTHSPDDGSASPLLTINAFYRRALKLGVTFKFKTVVTHIMTDREQVLGVATDTEQITAPVVIDAAGPRSRELCRTAGVDIPVVPDSHEGGITEPVQPFFETMVVDLRPGPGSSNYYFYQNRHGQVVFCITPDPPIVGMDMRETSVFLPQVCARMIDLLPRLKNLRVRRVWRGLYPMTPDGSPIVGWNPKVTGLLHATGMCGQGFMVGPGIGEVVARLMMREERAEDALVLERFRPDRSFGQSEALT